MPPPRFLPSAALASPAHTFFALGDHQNLRPEVVTQPLTASDLRLALTLQLLFSERLFLIAEDMLVNEHLMGHLLGEFRPALEHGLFVPLLRDRFESLSDCAIYLSEGDYYNQTGNTVWQHTLRALRTLPLTLGHFDEAQAYEHFTDGSRHILHDPALLDACGLHVSPLTLDNAITAAMQAAGRTTWRRSAIFQVAADWERRGLPREARALRRLGSVLYTSHFGGLLGQTSVFPDWYRDYIALLTSIPLSQSSHPGTPDVPSEIVQSLPNARLEDLRLLHFNDIRRIRSTREFGIYLDSLSGATGKAGSLTPVVAALGDYLRIIDVAVAEKHAGANSAPRRGEALLSVIRTSSAAGTVVGLGDALVNGIAPYSGPVLAATGLLFLASERFVAPRLDEASARRRRYWTSYCGTHGTFEAQLAGIAHRMQAT